MSPRSATIRIPQRRSCVPMAQKNNTGSSFSLLKVLNITRQKTTALIFALVALLILGFWTTHETRKTAKDIECLQIEKGRLSAQYQDFSTQMDQLKARSRMEKLGRKMGLHPPTGRQTISLN
ncbi:MAG: FtsL-like putative cell division protein [Thermodesulfobacteriota bacterium]|nr:FtsL-like putative cell division protein [Thermodesulfobacteriota bacterium]